MRIWLCIFAYLIMVPQAHARDQIRIVGSSTVFPFVAAAAEQFGKDESFRTPIVEATGTGGGIQMFCSGIDLTTPDMVNASRQIKSSEIALCHENGVDKITELKIGYDGIVMANAIESPTFNLTKAELFLALAKYVPINGKLVENSYQQWNEISPELPELEISIYGPPPTSGTRDAFAELIMKKGCEHFPEFAERHPDEDELEKACMAVREDGKFIEAGENDNLIVQKLVTNPAAIGVFGYNFLEQNAAMVKANPINGVMPSFENIVDGKYQVARSLYVYVKNGHADKVPGIREFARLLTSDSAVGESGFLILKGLLPAHPEEHQAIKKAAAELTPL